MKSYSPDKRSLTVLRIGATAAALILIAAVGIFIKIRVLRLVLSITFAAIGLIMIFFYLPMYFKRLSYCENGSEIKKTGGVFFKTSRSIKYSSIQYSTVITMPFSSHTGLNFIIFYVYGGKFLMLFLKKEDMQEILNSSGTLYGREA